MHRDIIIGNASAESMARWFAGVVTEIQWEHDLSPTETFSTEKAVMFEPSHETLNYSIRVHGNITTYAPKEPDKNWKKVRSMRNVRDAVLCEIRKGGVNIDGSERAQVVIDCQPFLDGFIQSWVINPLPRIFKVVQIRDELGNVLQPSETSEGDKHDNSTAVTNVSGGNTLSGEQIGIGGDVVGRDKNIYSITFGDAPYSGGAIPPMPGLLEEVNQQSSTSAS